MDKYLNLKRLTWVLKKFWFDHKKAFLLLMLTIASLLTIWFGIYLGLGLPRLFSEGFQVGYYFVGLFMSGCLSSNFLFADLSNKPRAIGYLLQPASSLEKIVGSLFFGVIIFLFGYSVVFYVVDNFMVYLTNNIHGTNWMVINIFTINDYNNPFFSSPASSLFFVYFASQALFITGSLYFNKYSFFKTVIVILVIGLVLIIIPSAAISYSMPLGIARSITEYEILDFRGNKIVAMPTWFDFSLTTFSFFTLTPALWLTSYFLLR